MKKIFIIALLAGWAFSAMAESYELNLVSNTSEFHPTLDAPYNHYKNTIAIKVTGTPASNTEVVLNRMPENTLMRDKNVATIKFITQSIYTINGGSKQTLKNGTITFVDEFNGSTYADHIRNEKGGDKAGSYIYTITRGTNSVTVPVYAASIFNTLTNDYSFTEILGDTKHTLNIQGTNVYFGEVEPNVSVDSWKIYKEGEEFTTGQSCDDEANTSMQTYSGELKIGNNTYGTDETSVYPGVVDGFVSNGVKTEDVFQKDGLNCRYYTNSLVLFFEHEVQEGIKTLPVPTIATGGYRVWRTVTSPATSEKLIYDNVGKEDGLVNYKEDVAKDDVFFAEIGSTVIYKIRAYYYMKPYVPNPFGAPALHAPAVNEDSETRYYICEMEFEFELVDDDEDLIITGVDNISAKQISSVKYYNVAGVESSEAFKGMNIVVTRYTDGSTSTSKVIR